MTSKTIPAALIPELVEWLVDAYGVSCNSFGAKYKCYFLNVRASQTTGVRDNLITAFKAFNERDQDDT